MVSGEQFDLDPSPHGPLRLRPRLPGLGEPWVSEPRPFPHLLLLFLLLHAVRESTSCLGSAARGARAQASSWAGIF